ncbi:MAG: hypothetical protein OEY49_11170, partial [Candidatus Heimdallarchaeota archaeon]|nr:hypothetical protein [Candidatus Heimdallarchaeota archaeon]
MHDQIEVTKRDAVVQQSAILMQYYGEFSYFPVKAMLIEEGMNLETVNNNTMFQLLYKIIIRELKKNNSIVRHFRTEMIDKLPEKWRIFKNIIT